MTQIKKNVKIISVSVFILILFLIWIIFHYKSTKLVKNIKKNQSITNTDIWKKDNTKEEDNKLLNYLDKYKWHYVKLDWTEMFVDSNFNWKSLKNFPKIKKSLDKLITKLKSLWLNDNNTNFIIKSQGVLPWPFLSISATDKNKAKTLKKYKKEAVNKINKVAKENKAIAKDLLNRINTEISIMANNNNNGYCLSSTMLWIKTWTSVQVCPDKDTLTKMVRNNKFIVQGTNKVFTIMNMPSYTSQNMTTSSNWFKKIYNYNAYLLYFPYVINKNIVGTMKGFLDWYYNNMLKFNKMLYNDSGILLVNLFTASDDILLNKNKKDPTKIIKKVYLEYQKEAKKYKNEKVINYISFTQKVNYILSIINKYGKNLNMIEYYSLTWTSTPDNIHSKIIILDKKIQNSYFETLLKDKKVLSEINSNFNDTIIKTKKWKKIVLNKIWKDKVILWFYLDILNILPNLAIDLYPQDQYFINLYLKHWLNNGKYSELLDSWFIQNETNTKNNFQLFLYNISNGGIIIPPRENDNFDFSLIWDLFKNNNSKNANQKARDLILKYNAQLFTSNKLCQKIIILDKKYWLKSFVIAYKCSINSYVLDTFNKKISLFNKRVSKFWMLVWGWKQKIMPWLASSKFFLLLKLYPDVMYWRFDTPKERLKFFNDFKLALDMLQKSSDSKVWEARFKRMMAPYYQYFNDINDYIHLRANINTLDLIFYWQK